MAGKKRDNRDLPERRKVGANLARIRSEQGLTHENMEEYGISRAFYGRIELGKASPSLSTLIRIARAFGVSLSDLFIDAQGRKL